MLIDKIKKYLELKKNLIIASSIVATILIVYCPIISSEFINLDDPDYVIDNQYIHKGISIDSLKWAFRIPCVGEEIVTYWHPLTWISHMLDYELFGLDPGMHHLMNVLFHIINSLLIFHILHRMTGSSWSSAFVAALFALHPMNVDSVAWVAERKNLLSTFLWLLTTLLYFRYSRSSNLTQYLSTIGMFILGLLAKPMLVTLPFVLFLMDYWPLKRFSFGDTGNNDSGRLRALWKCKYQGVRLSSLIMEKVPFIFLALVSISISSLSLRRGGALVSMDSVPMGLRIQNAIVSYLIYIKKLLWPFDLTIFYPYPDYIPLWKVIGASVLIVFITAAALRLVLRAPYFIVGWLWFLGTLVPVSGIMQGGLWPEIADRWAYVPFIGLFIIVAWGAPQVMQSLRYRGVLLVASGTAVLCLLMVISHMQTGIWKNSVTLFSHALQVNRDNFVAHSNLASEYANQGKKIEAVRHYKEAVRIHANDLIALNSLGRLYGEMGQIDDSIHYYSQAVLYNPTDIKANFELGAMYTRKNSYDNARRQFSRVIELDPKFSMAYYNLGVISVKQGKKEEAIQDFSSALQLDPDDFQSHLAIGIVFMNLGREDDAAHHFKEALRIDPQSREARNYLGKVRGPISDGQDEMTLLEGNQEKEPDRPEVLHKLAILYSQQDEYSKALDILHRLLKIQPDNPDVYYNIACIFSRQGDIENSIQWLEKSIHRGFRDWDLLKKDKDLDNIRKTKYYSDLVNRFMKRNIGNDGS